jgi:hypothetical protein
MNNTLHIAAPQSAHASTPSSIINLIRHKLPIGSMSFLIQQVTPPGNLTVGSPAGDVAYVSVYEQYDTPRTAVFTVVYSTGVFTSAGHGLKTGDSVTVSNVGGGLPAGLTAGTTYYVIWVSANTFKLSLTQADALAGTDSVTALLSGNGTGTNSFVYTQLLIGAVTQVNSGGQTRLDIITVQKYLILKANSTLGKAFLKFEISSRNILMQGGQLEFFDVGKSNLGGTDFDATYNGEPAIPVWPNPALSQI